MAEEQSVQGIRHPARTPARTAMGCLGIVLMLSPVAWLVVFIRNACHGTMDGPFTSLWWPILAVVLFFVGMFMLSGFESKYMLESDCPNCGAHATREFSFPPKICGSCIAYLRAEGDRVREESMDATNDSGYWVQRSRYEPAEKRNERGRIAFKMPSICAICGTTETSDTVDVHVGTAISSSGPSWLGMAIVATSSGSTRRKMGLRYDGTVRTSGPSSPTDEDRMREELADVKVPVCRDHAGSRPLKCIDRTLEFESYRYYKEFLALNYIDAPEPKA